MKRIPLFVFFVFGLLPVAWSQSSNVLKDAIAAKMVRLYNEKKYDSIYQMYSPDTKKLITLPKTREFFDKFQKQEGSIQKYTFIEEKDIYSRYRAELAKGGVYWMIFSEYRAEITSLYFMVYDGPEEIRPSKRNTTNLDLPFKGEWFVFWGGDTKKDNYHVINKAQKNAFDIIIIDEKNRSFKTNGGKNEDYYAFGQPLFAACDAVVVAVRDGVPDNIPGKMNEKQVTGNSVFLKTANDEYLLYAHFKMNSIKVKEGDKVKKGQLLGLCGNSGNSSEPHLHFHLQDKPSMTEATGIKSFFEKIKVNGEEKKDYSPVKGEKIENAN